jgi:hypothetical protein
MIDSVIRRMTFWILTWLGMNPSMERARARMPYCVWKGMVVAAAIVPFAAILLLAQALGWRGTPDTSLMRSLVILAACVPGFTAIFALITAVAWLSGYRHAERRWKGLRPEEADALCAALHEAAEAQAFETMWRGRHGAFVGVRDLALDWEKITLSGTRFPMRLSVFAQEDARGLVEVGMRVAARSLVVWNTGERQRCEAMGEMLAEMAKGRAVSV